MLSTISQGERKKTVLKEHWASTTCMQVLSIHYDCDRDSIIYLSEPTGPSCHTGTESCWYQAVSIENDTVVLTGKELSAESAPRTSLQELQYTIEQRKLQAANAKEGVRRAHA